MSLSPNIAAYRGPNHVLVTRHTTRAALRARTRKLLESRRWPSVHLHGLGAAIATTIVLASELTAASQGQLVASCSTSTEVLVDHNDAAATSGLRHNSAVHVVLSLRKQAATAQPAATAPGNSNKARRKKPAVPR